MIDPSQIPVLDPRMAGAIPNGKHQPSFKILTVKDLSEIGNPQVLQRLFENKS